MDIYPLLANFLAYFFKNELSFDLKQRQRFKYVHIDPNT